jgi:hypothetical protein
VDAEELQQQAEREFQNPGRWGLTFPTSSAGACDARIEVKRLR